jgi:transglutaminase superfamily protein
MSRLHRAPDLPTLRLACWAWRAIRAARQGVRRGGLSDIRLPPVPGAGERAGRGVRAVLDRSNASCLVRALVLQAWEASRGRPRDLVIGVTAPSDDFEAHAWLDGDEPPTGRPFSELVRQPAG